MGSGFGYNDEDYLVKKQCSLGSSGNVYMILGDVNSALNYIVLPSESWNTAYKDQQQNNILSHYYKWYYNPASPESFCPDLDIPVSISAIYAGLLPYTSSGSTNVWAEYDNRTSSIPNGCAEYESFCYPDVPDGYVYDEDDIVCVGVSCYVEAGEECNNNGVCDTPFETQASCPADCVVPTPEEISDIINNTLEDIGEMIGTDAIGMKFIIWVVISLIVSVGLTILIASAGGSSGAGVAFLITMILFMLIGSVIAWIPMWIGIVFVIIAGFILSFVLKGIFATG